MMQNMSYLTVFMIKTLGSCYNIIGEVLVNELLDINIYYSLALYV